MWIISEVYESETTIWKEGFGTKEMALGYLLDTVDLKISDLYVETDGSYRLDHDQYYQITEVVLFTEIR